MLDVILPLRLRDIGCGNTQVPVFTNGDADQGSQPGIGKEVLPADVIGGLCKALVSGGLIARPRGGQRGLAACISGSWCSPRAGRQPVSGPEYGNGATGVTENMKTCAYSFPGTDGAEDGVSGRSLRRSTLNRRSTTTKKTGTK